MRGFLGYKSVYMHRRVEKDVVWYRYGLRVGVAGLNLGMSRYMMNW